MPGQTRLEAKSPFTTSDGTIIPGWITSKPEGEGWQSVIHPDDLQYTLDQYKLIQETSDGGEFQNRKKRADGVYRWYLIRLRPIKNKEGELPLWVGTATDINDLRLLQQQKDDFMSIASHELKTPITTLKASLQLLDRMKYNPNQMLVTFVEQANKSDGKGNHAH